MVRIYGKFMNEISLKQSDDPSISKLLPILYGHELKSLSSFNTRKENSMGSQEWTKQLAATNSQEAKKKKKPEQEVAVEFFMGL